MRVDGNLDAYGRGAPTAGALNGGNGAAVTITGTNVQTHDINTTGGGSNAAFPGASAPVVITARGSLNAFGSLDASGQNGANGTGAAGSQITLKAAGPLAIGDDVNAGGGQSAGGGAVTIAGSTVTSSNVVATGGNGSGGDAAGGPGGSISVTAPERSSAGIAARLRRQLPGRRRRRFGRAGQRQQLGGLDRPQQRADPGRIPEQRAGRQRRVDHARRRRTT